MTHEPNTEHVDALAAIIREVNGGQRFGAAALAEAILSHSNSQWRPALPVPTDVELEADFRAWFKGRYPFFGGIILRDVIAWGKHLLQRSPQPASPWPQLPRETPPEVLNRAMSICKVEAVKVVWHAACDELENLKPSPQFTEDQDRQRAAAVAEAAWQWKRYKGTRDQEGEGVAPTPVPASWPELPPQPPGSPSRGENPYWTDGFVTGWAVARAELQRLREQAGVAPAAPTFPRISDSLMRSLIGDVLGESEAATKAACMDRPYNPVPRIRARLTEILRLAARDEAAGKPTP